MQTTRPAAGHRGVLRFLLGAIALLTSIATAAPITFVETGDTGRLPIAAQSAQATGIDTLVAIEGNLANANPFLNAFDVDMYRIYIHDPGAFSARTIAAPGLNVSDPMLFLFDTNGRAVYMNDDELGAGGQSLLPAGHVLGPAAAGFYYLAIAWWDNQPTDALNALLFLAGAAGEIRGPAGASPVAGWTENVLHRIDLGTAYRIELTGAGREPVPVPEPAPAWLALACLLALAPFTVRHRALRRSCQRSNRRPTPTGSCSRRASR